MKTGDQIDDSGNETETAKRFEERPGPETRSRDDLALLPGDGETQIETDCSTEQPEPKSMDRCEE